MTTEQPNRWEAFGREVALRRRTLGDQRGLPFTQKQLAERVGVTEKQISRIETAVSGTDYGTVLKMAEALEYDEKEKRVFFRLAGLSYPQTKEGAAHDAPNTLDDAFTWFQNLSADIQSTARDLLRAMYEADRAIHAPDRLTQEAVPYVAHAQKFADLHEGEELIIINRKTGSLYNLDRETIIGDNLIELVTLMASNIEASSEQNKQGNSESNSSAKTLYTSSLS